MTPRPELPPELVERIRREVDRAPALTAEQRDALRVLLRATAPRSVNPRKDAA